MAARKRRVRKESPANVQLLEKIRALKCDHPSWGYKRITAWLRRREHMKANHTLVVRLHYPPGQFLFGFPRFLQGGEYALVPDSDASSRDSISTIWWGTRGRPSPSICPAGTPSPWNA